MGKMLTASLALVLTMLAPTARAQDIPYADQPFSADQLDNLMAPIALYPDPLLAQVLIAATFPDQIDEAARFVRGDPSTNDVDDQAWDVSVRAVAHYPTVLAMMADKIDWTTTVGQAYVSQSTDVMESIQRLRAQAQSLGNLVTTPEMEVVDSDQVIELWPAQAEYIYVPLYNPALVFSYRTSLSFQTRLLIGAWLNDDFDWRAHRVFYHGWARGHGGWIDRSRPHVHMTNVYVNRKYQNVAIGRSVIDRQVNYAALNRYNDVHRQTTFNNIRGRQAGPNVTEPVNKQPIPANKIIDRNINTNDPRIGQYRGYPHEAVPPARAPATPVVTPNRGGHSVAPPPQVHEPAVPAFTPDPPGSFDPRQASRRGVVSRARAANPPSSPTPARPQKKKQH